MWWFGDTYRLALAGYAADYGRLWSEAFAALARSRPARSPVRLTADPRPQQRAVFCQLEGAADVAGPDGVRIELLAVPALAGSRCAAFWPTRAGWHVLESSASPLSFHVRPAGTANGIAAYQLREQTLRLVTAPGAGSLSSRTPVPGPRWPWFLAWLIASGLVWWLERRERGESDSGAVPAAE